MLHLDLFTFNKERVRRKLLLLQWKTLTVECLGSIRSKHRSNFLIRNPLSRYPTNKIISGSMIHSLDCKYVKSHCRRLFNPFIPNAPFLYLLKTTEILTIFWCFQWIEKGCIGLRTCKMFIMKLFFENSERY